MIVIFCLLFPVALAMSLRAQAQWRDFDRARALFAQAEDEVHHQQYAEAIENLDQVIGLCPDYLAAWDLLAHCHVLSSQPEKAVECLQEACRVHPEISQFRTTLGQVYLSLEQPGKASEQFDLAMKLDPTDPLPARLKESLSEPAQGSVQGSEGGQHNQPDQEAEQTQ